MTWHTSPIQLVLFLGATSSLVLAMYGVVRYRRDGSHDYVVAFVVLCLAVSIWSFVYGIQIGLTDLDAKLRAYTLLHVGGVTVPPAWFAFALAYSNRSKWLTWKTIGAIFVIPVALLLALPTNPYSLALTDVALESRGSLTVLVTGNGPLYVLHLAVSYVLLVLGSLLVASHAVGSSSHVRRQSLLLVAAVLFPLVLNVWQFVELPPLDAVPVNLTPVSLSVSALLIGVAIFRYRLLDVRPVARATVFDSMDEGVLVVDDRDLIVDYNPAARSFLPDGSDPLGNPVSAVLPGSETVAESGDEIVEVADPRDGEARLVQVTRTEFASARSTDRGWVYLLKDITEVETHRRALVRRNERLDAFASTISHDLRNSLSVITGFSELARTDPDDEYFDRIDAAAGHMDEFMEDLLALSQQGRTIDDGLPVSLASVVEEARAQLDEDALALECDVDATVVADRTRLRQALNNLFRNSVDHGDGEVTIRVGLLPDGFSVEDDGPGIPTEDRERVFDVGYTTHVDGTGIGLVIVHDIVAAHGWAVRVTDGSDGGARFEITGVETVE